MKPNLTPDTPHTITISVCPSGDAPLAAALHWLRRSTWEVKLTNGETWEAELVCGDDVTDVVTFRLWDQYRGDYVGALRTVSATDIAALTYL